jgi:hypothetical protein
MKKKVSLSELGSMGAGLLNTIVTRELQKLGKDCVDRPSLKKARTLRIEFALTPIEEDGIADEVNIKWKVPPGKLPAAESRDYSVQVHPSGTLLVNEESPDAPAQRTLDEAGPDGAPSDDEIASDSKKGGVTAVTLSAVLPNGETKSVTLTRKGRKAR